MREPFALTRSASLTTRVALLSATVVAVSVSLMAAAAYFVVYRAMYNDIDRQLESRADGMTALSRTGALGGNPQRVVSGAVFSTNISVALIRPDGQTFLVGSVPFDAPERRIVRSANRPGQHNQSLRTVDDQRVLARKLDDGYSLIMAQSLLHTERVLKRLAWVLLVVGGGGVALAALAGTTVARTGLRPVARLTR
ncbi:MAG: two-component sensor histidine kinase, partial [Gordonia sp. (in: high G+C Gram-positive bacteria)]